MATFLARRAATALLVLCTAYGMAKGRAGEVRASATPGPTLPLSAAPTPAATTATTATSDVSDAASSASATMRVHAVLVNGGGRRETNYRSHLQHVRTLVALLTTAGVRREQIVVFSADGADPAADLATREDEPVRGAWILPRSAAGPLGPQTDYVSSALEGYTLRPAHVEALRAWFAEEGTRLRAGDTLLFYVTDHGDKNEKDTTNNTITLWGEALSVDDLQGLLATVDPGVRVVLVMSQCFAGAFARLMYRAADDALPTGQVCGFFSAPSDRPAYGCYAENRGKEGVGHSHHFLRALAELGRFSEAEQRVLVTDDSPDVPHSTLDVFVGDRLRAAAEAAGEEPRQYADGLIATAWRQPAAFEPAIRLLDRIGQAFGSFSPRSLAELDEQARALPELSARLKTYADRWRDALESLRVENFARFLDAEPAWRPRLAATALAALNADDRRATVRTLLVALVPFTGHDPVRHARLLSLKRKADDAAAAYYRAEVRVGVVLRLRAVLMRIAGEVLLARDGGDARRAGDALASCEAFQLGDVPPASTAASLPAPPPFPPLAAEERLLTGLLPAYMGIDFRPLEEAKRARLHVRRGAVNVLHVYPDSPAEHAGVEIGDVVLGPPGAPFEEPNQVREWTMRRQIDVPTPLAIVRDSEMRTITLRPGPFPLTLPKLPGPPKIGSAAPPLELELFRGRTDFAAPRTRLLFFWATWCTICKQSLPEVLAFEAIRGVDVVAITDESAETLRTFFHDERAAFPEVVARDPRRRLFQHYGVSGTPTFVLVDRAGVIREYQTGYPPEGLRIEGWHWREDAKALSAE
ncbi:MAG: redoxin family protein [Deltaproteobacteria bacterium]|nr:redoxin family protein [Deltaproteobacteria bacterium]